MKEEVADDHCLVGDEDLEKLKLFTVTVVS
jgi:hypothetical protein